MKFVFRSVNMRLVLILLFGAWLSVGARRHPKVYNADGSAWTGESSNNGTRVARGPMGRPFGAITRDEWLAKEYFGYLCGESVR